MKLEEPEKKDFCIWHKVKVKSYFYYIFIKKRFFSEKEKNEKNKFKLSVGFKLIEDNKYSNFSLNL